MEDHLRPAVHAEDSRSSIETEPEVALGRQSGQGLDPRPVLGAQARGDVGAIGLEGGPEGCVIADTHMASGLRLPAADVSDRARRSLFGRARRPVWEVALDGEQRFRSPARRDRARGLDRAPPLSCLRARSRSAGHSRRPLDGRRDQCELDRGDDELEFLLRRSPSATVPGSAGALGRTPPLLELGRHRERLGRVDDEHDERRQFCRSTVENFHCRSGRMPVH